MLQKGLLDIVRILEIENLIVFLILSTSLLFYLRHWAENPHSSIFLVIKLFLVLRVVKINPSRSSSVDIFFRKLCLVCSLSLQQGECSIIFPSFWLKETYHTSSWLSLLYLFLESVSKLLIHSISTFMHAYLLFPVTLTTLSIVLLLHHWSQLSPYCHPSRWNTILLQQPGDTHSCCF